MGLYPGEKFADDVPLSAILHVCHAGGRHEPERRKHSPYDTSTSYDYRHRHSKGVTIFPLSDYEKERLHNAGNLQNEEYRWYLGATQGNWSQCRFCRHSCLSPSARREHNLKANCRTNLMVVYRWLKSQNPTRCICCGSITTCEKWGIPMCTEPRCTYDWRFSYVEQAQMLKAKKACTEMGLLLETR
jgi:hypothetical protein